MRHKAETWSKWRGLVTELRGSGKSVAAFCQERGLPVSQMLADAGSNYRIEGKPARCVNAEVTPATEWRAGWSCPSSCFGGLMPSEPSSAFSIGRLINNSRDHLWDQISDFRYRYNHYDALRDSLESSASLIPVFFHGDNTGTNPAGDANNTDRICFNFPWVRSPPGTAASHCIPK